MNLKKLGLFVSFAGAVAVIGAMIWWYTFYSSVIRDFSGQVGQQVGGISDVMGCLYSTSGVCGIVSGIASVAGRAAYDPLLFWAGAVALGAGLVMRFAAK